MIHTAFSSDLPYRPNVGIALFNMKGELFFAQRADLPGSIWQCPQGGIDAGEDITEAAWREMEEEIGTRNAVLLGEKEDWISYDFPSSLIGHALSGRYRGQKQKWLVFGFKGKDSDINLAHQTPQEFNDWRWVNPLDILDGDFDLGFKRTLYEMIIPQLSDIFHNAPKDWMPTNRA